MVQFITTILSSSVLLAGFAIAQDPNASFNSSVISQVAGELDPNTASAWCNAQYHACNVLCGKASANNCTTSTLDYTCLCTSNNSAPAFQYYNPTMLTNICNRYLGDCLKTTAGSQSDQANCQATIICGNSSVDAFANSSAASPSSASSSMSATATSGSTSNTASPSPTKNAAALLEIGASYGTGIFGAVVFAVLGLGL